MRRILAISIAAAIPAVVPVHAVNAYTKPAPPPAASGHSRPAHGVHAKHAIHSRSAPMGETRDRPSRPENDVQVDADDGGGSPQAPAAAPEHSAAGAHGATGAHSAHGRSSKPTRSRPASRPGTGADGGFADADDPALPPEAAAALQEAADLQGSAQGAAGPGNNAPGNTAPGNTAPGNNAPNATPPGATAPGATAPNATAPRGPGRSVGRPARPVTDQSTNQTSSRKAGRTGRMAPMPVAFYSNTNPVPQGSRLVLRTSAGNGPAHTVTLQCDPIGGTHPKAAEACADVAKAGGQLAQMPAGANPRACFMIYAPVTVTARGDWQGQAVRFTEKFPNTCVMRDKTGSVFDF
jgi:hypothetical protein